MWYLLVRMATISRRVAYGPNVAQLTLLLCYSAAFCAAACLKNETK